jgi:hypothetical protein
MALGRFLDKLKGVVAPIAKVAAPIAGTAIGGPLGGVLAGGLVGGLTSEDKVKGALMGAGTTAAGIGAAKALGAGAQAATDTAATAAQTATAATAAPAAAAGGFGQIDPMMAAKTAFAPSAAAPAVQGTFNPALTQAAASGAVPTGPDPVVMSAGAPDLGSSLPEIGTQPMVAPEGYVPMEQRMFSPDPGGVSMGEGGNLVGNASFGQTGRESALAGPREGLDFRIAEKSPSGRLMGALTGIGQWAQENPELALGIASAAEGIFTTSAEELAAQKYENEIARRSAIQELLLDSGISF